MPDDRNTIPVAGGLDRKGGSDNFVADVQANDETTQKEEEKRSSEETELETQIDTSAPVTAGSRIAVVRRA